MRLLALALLVACAPDVGSTDVVTVRDSAGVTFHEVTGDSADWTDWSIAADPTVTIGSVDGRETLAYVRDVLELPDGSLVIANYGSMDLRFYSSSGTRMHTVGRRGEGPFEFGYIDWIQLVRDSVWVYDGQNRRVTVFDLQGAPGRMQSLSQVGSQSYIWAAGVFADGSILLRGSAVPRQEYGEGLNEYDWPYLVLDRDGELHEQGMFFGAETHVARINAQTTFENEAPFGPHAEVATAGDLWYYSAGSEYRVEVRSADGTLRRVHVLHREPERVRSEHLDTLIESVWGDQPRESRPSPGERAYRSLPLPERMPAYDRMLAGTDGSIWVRPFTVTGRECWHVFEPEPAGFARLCLPDDFIPYDVTRERVIGVLRDDLDVERVVAYELIRPSDTLIR